MIKSYIALLVNKGYWLNAVLLFYPFAIIAIFSYIFSEKDNGLLFLLIKATVFNALFLSSILMLGTAMRNERIKKNMLRIIYFFQFLGVFLFVYHFFLYRQLVGLSSVYALIDTNFHEAIEFFGANFKLNNLAITILLACPMILGIVKPYRLPIYNGKLKYFFPLLPLSVIFAIIYLTVSEKDRDYWMTYNPLLIIPSYVSVAVEEKNKINVLYSTMASIPHVNLERPHNQMTHILVLSESINRSHMALYGYNRHTNPKLTQLANELYIQKDACSSRNTTIASLKEMLTFANREDASYLFKAPNIIQIMHAAGFETYWLSNQQEVGVYDSFISIFAKSADHKLFVDHRGWQRGMSFDEKLIEPLKNILAGGAKKKFIVVHLIGAHPDYIARYPRKYAVFDNLITANPKADHANFSPLAMKTFNEYDNAVLYNDYIASQLIALQNNKDWISLSYISDHGESLADKDEFFGHSEDLHYRSINEIPLFFWFSKPAKRGVANKIGQLNSHLATPFQSDQLIHSLLDLYGIQYYLINYKHSLFNASFKPKARYCDSPLVMQND